MGKKILKISLITLGILLLLAIVLPFMFKGKIIAKVQEEANKNLNAKLHFEGVSLSLFRSFPNFSLSLDQLSIEGINEFKGDTLIKAKEISLTLDLMSVISGDQININKIFLDEPNIRLVVLKNGKANWDITKPSAPEEKSAPSEPSTFKASLKKYGINNGHIVYDDRTMPFYTEVFGLNHSGSGDFTADKTKLETETTIDSLDLKYDGVTYFNKAKVEYNADFDLDLANSIYQFSENELKINDLALKFAGKVSMPADDIGIDLTWEALKNEVKSFISLIPGAYTADFKDVKSSGKMALKGYVKGIYNEKLMPGFGLNLLIENGTIQYPSLPKSITNIQLKTNIDCPSGNFDKTIVDVSKLHVDMGPFPLDARILVKTPVSDPDVDMTLKSNIDLGAVKQFVPLDKGTDLNGMLNIDAAFKGRMSVVESGQYEKFYAAGKAVLSNFKYKAADLPQDVNISKAAMTINPQFIELTELVVKTGKSDIQASGKLSNYLAYALRGEAIKGNLNMRSNFLDVNPFMTTTEESPAPATTGAPAEVSGYIRVPKNIDFALNTSISKLIYDNMSISDVSGTLLMKDGTVDLNNLLMNTLGGSISMSGLYDTRNDAGPVVDLNLNMKDLDVKACAKTFNSIKQLAPIAEHVTGKVSLENFHFSTQTDAAFNPVLNTINGGGTLRTSSIEIEGFEMVKRTAEQLKIEKLKKWKLEKIQLSFTIVNGQITVKPFDTKIGNYKATIGGKSSLDQAIDYAVNMEIPRSEFGGAANSVLNSMVSRANAKGFKGNLADQIPVTVRITGTFKDPKVTTDIKQQANDVMNDLKKQAEDKAREELEKQKKALEDRANAEKEKLKKEAEEKLNKEKEKLKSAADKAKADAEAKAKAEADKAKKKAEEEAKKGFNKLLKGK
jgi:hypothetical protein